MDICETMTAYERFCWGVLGLLAVTLSYFAVGGGLLSSLRLGVGRVFLPYEKIVEKSVVGLVDRPWRCLFLPGFEPLG